MSTWSHIACWRYRTRLEDRVSGKRLRPETDPQLDAHLSGCTECRQALDDAFLANGLLREAGAPVIDSPNRFSTRVMVAIREEIARREAPNVIWRPLELLASRFAVAAATVLLLLSIYLAEFAPPFRPAAIASQTEVSAQTESGPVMPEPPAQPSSPDEVLLSLAGEGQ